MKALTLPLVAGIMAAGLAPAWAQTLSIGLKSEATSMDPQFHQLSTNIQVAKNIFEALTTQDALQKSPPAWPKAGRRLTTPPGGSSCARGSSSTTAVTSPRAT